jgi:hypothetical protein
MRFSAAFNRDANNVPIANKGFIVTKTIAYNGTVGAQGAATLFTVTGDVIVSIFAKCTEDLAGVNATIEVGISGNTASLIAQTTATTIDSGEIWLDTSAATVESVPAEKLLVGGTDIIETIATADITDGTLTYYCLWYPLSSDAEVTAA